MKEFFKKKGIGFYFQAVGIVFSLVALIAYSIAGTDSYGFVPAVDVLLVLAILSGVFFCRKDYFGAGPMVTMIFTGSATGVFLLSRFMYYSHQFYHIASDPITGAMIATTIGFVGMLVCGICAGCFSAEKGGDKE